MRKLILVFFMLLAVSVCVFLGIRHFNRTDNTARELTLRLLTTIPQSILILETEEHLALPVIESGNWLFGPRRGQASIRLRSHWGCDLRSISPSDVEVIGSKVRIRLPPPTLFDTAPDLSSWRYIGKRSGLRCIADLATGRSLESELLRIVARFPQESASRDVNVRRQAFVERLNHDTAEIFSGHKLAVEFY